MHNTHTGYKSADWLIAINRTNLVCVPECCDLSIAYFHVFSWMRKYLVLLEKFLGKERELLQKDFYHLIV